MRQTSLNRVQHLLSHLGSLRNKNNPDVRVHTNTVRHIVDGYRSGLTMLRRHVSNNQVLLTRLKRHARMKPRRLPALNHIHHILHVRENRGTQILLTKRRKRHSLAASSLSLRIKFPHSTDTINSPSKVRVLLAPPLIGGTSTIHNLQSRRNTDTLRLHDTQQFQFSSLQLFRRSTCHTNSP